MRIILYCGVLGATGVAGVVDRALKKGSFPSIVAILTPLGTLLAGDIEELKKLIEEFSTHNSWWVLTLAPNQTAQGLRQIRTGMTNAQTVKALNASKGADESLLALIPASIRRGLMIAS